MKISTSAKVLIKRCLFKTKLYRLRNILNRYYVLQYHMVPHSPTGFYPEVSIMDFEKQIVYLARNYKVISLDEIVRRVNNRDSLRRCVAITFDDGFKDNYENAYPILKKYNVPATIFLTTGYIEQKAVPWFIKLRYVFMKTVRTHLQLPLDNRAFSLPMRTKREKLEASNKIMAYLKDCPDQKREPLLNNICDYVGVNQFQEIADLMLTWSQIKEMSENGISFGAHTVNHPILTQMPLDAVEKEISQSKETIESKINKTVTSFAYPFGKREHYSHEFFPTLQKLHFDCAVTTEMGINTYKDNLFELNRIRWELFI